MFQFSGGDFVGEVRLFKHVLDMQNHVKASSARAQLDLSQNLNKATSKELYNHEHSSELTLGFHIF